MATQIDVRDQEGLRERVARIERLIAEFEQVPDPAIRAAVEEVIGAVLELHGTALDRMLELVAGSGEQGDTLLAALAADPLVTHVLLLHGLHPVPLRARVEEALESVRPYMRSHGGGVELVSVEGDTVHLKLEGSCDGCPSSAMTMRSAVEKAIMEAAPDVAAIEVDGVAEPAPAPGAPALIPIPMINGNAAAGGNGGGRPAGPPPTEWARVDAATSVEEGEVRRLDAGDTRILVCRVEGTLYAYAVRCPACQGDMAAATLVERSLVCPGCGRGYDVRRAGRSAQTPYLLEPSPLLEEGGSVRVAVPSAAR